MDDRERENTRPMKTPAHAFDVAKGEWSFDALYARYQAQIYRYILSLITTPMQAEDLTQEVFVRVLRALPRLSADCDISAWIYRIARNISIDVLRRRRLINWSSIEEDAFQEVGTRSCDPQVRYDGYSEEVLLALERMPSKARKVLMLYEVEGASYDQIAQTAHIARGGVKMSLSRARKNFRQHYLNAQAEG